MKRWVATIAVGVTAGLGPVAAPAPAGAAAGDDAIEKKAVLRKSDFPAGWDSSSRGAPTDRGLEICAGIDAANAALAPLATRSRDFTLRDADYVLANSSVVVLGSKKRAKAFLEPYRDESALACLEALTQESLTEAGFTAVRVYATPSDAVPSGAHDAAAFELQVTVTTAGSPGQAPETRVLYQDLLVVRVGRALANFGFLNEDKPLPEQAELADAVIGRLQDAL